MQKEICVWKRIGYILRKNMIENVSRETYVRPFSALRGFLGSFLPSVGSLPAFYPLFSPYLYFPPGGKSPERLFSLRTWAGFVQSGHMAEHGCLVHMYFRRDEPKKWPKKQTADLTAEQRHLALRLPAKTSAAAIICICRAEVGKTGMTKVPGKSAVANKNVR